MAFGTRHWIVCVDRLAHSAAGAGDDAGARFGRAGSDREDDGAFAGPALAQRCFDRWTKVRGDARTGRGRSADCGNWDQPESNGISGGTRSDIVAYGRRGGPAAKTFLPRWWKQWISFALKQPDEIRRLFEAASSYARGLRVRVENNGVEGVTQGLDPSGFLIVKQDNGEHATILAGGVRPCC